MRRKWTELVKKCVFVTTVLCGLRAEAGIVGLWEFNDSANIGRATIGNNLAIAGTAPVFSATQTYAGRTLTGVIDTVVGVGNHLVATPGIAPNNGGTKVNQYSMLFDFRSPNNAVWRTFFQTDPTNTNDGDYFIRNTDNKLGVGLLNYTDYVVVNDTWTRLVLTANIGAGASTYLAYIDGALVFTHGTTPLDGRHAFDPTVLLFGDEDGENGSLSIGAVAIWDSAINTNEVAALGVAGAAIAVPEPGSLLLAGTIGLGVVTMRLLNRKHRKHR